MSTLFILSSVILITTLGLSISPSSSMLMIARSPLPFRGRAGPIEEPRLRAGARSISEAIISRAGAIISRAGAMIVSRTGAITGPLERP